MKNKIITSFLAVILLVVSVWSVSAQNQDDLLFRRRVVSSGVNSFFYGTALVVMIEPESEAAIAGIPIIAAGLGALVPVLINESRPITVNQLTLTTHGQLIGWAHGFGLSALVMGDNLENGDNYKIAIGMGAATSIGMGILGKSFGKNKPWSEGQASMFAHWGGIMPVTTFFGALSVSEDVRLAGASVLLGGAAGYLIGNSINRQDAYTRGDVRAIGTLTALNGALGAFIYGDIIGSGEAEPGQWGWLCPAAGIISGTLIGQAWLKNADLTPRQGMTSIWSATGGAVLGLGVALLVNSESITPWYAIPYATSLGSYALAVEMMKKKNAGMVSITDGGKNHWSFSIMPQNYFLNEKIAGSGFKLNGQDARMQPLVSASVTF